MQRLRAWFGISVLGMATFVLTHQIVFVDTYGAGTDAALVRTGHGGGWTLTEFLAIGMALALALLSGTELTRLSRRARVLEGTPFAGTDQPLGDLVRPLLHGWVLLALAGALLFTCSENLEHALIGAPLPGIGVFGGPEYSSTLPILVAVSFCLAGLRAVYGWRRATLIARLALARRRVRHQHSPAARWQARDIDRRPSTYIGRGFAKRAPPRRAVV